GVTNRRFGGPPPSERVASRMWLWPVSRPSFHVAASVPARRASDGNSIVRMYIPVPSFIAPKSNAGVTFAIVELENVRPPSCEVNSTWLNVIGFPTQWGSNVAMRSAATNRVPFAGLINGCAPMNWLNEHPSPNAGAFDAQVTCHVWPPASDRAA